MPGTTVVTIVDNQWAVSVASTTTELTTGLSGVASISAGTGMLFILPARQLVTVNTSQMLFPIDIIFIKDNAVLDIARNISPGYLVEEATPCDMFLEVNANEAELVEVGDIVSVATIVQEPGIDWSSIMSSIAPLAILGLVLGMIGPMFGGSSSSNPKQLKSGSNPDKYYWEITDIDTGEIMQRGKAYTSKIRAMGGAESYQKGRTGKDKEHSVVIRVFDTPNWEEWGKTVRPVVEIGMHHGRLTDIGKTPLQRAALDRLWPYSIKEIHSDGDLTVISTATAPGGHKYVVTTEGGVFVDIKGEEATRGLAEALKKQLAEGGSGQETHPVHCVSCGWTGNRAYGPLKPCPKCGGVVVWTFTGKTKPIPLNWYEVISSETLDGQEGYRVKNYSPVGWPENPTIEESEHWIAKGVYNYWQRRASPWTFESWKVEIWKEVGKPLSEPHSIHGEPRRRLVEQYGSWAVGRAEAICPEDDITCVDREAKRLIETLRSRYGEAPMRYVTITDPGKTIFHSGDVVSVIALERENERVIKLKEREATWSA